MRRQAVTCFSNSGLSGNFALDKHSGAAHGSLRPAKTDVPVAVRSNVTTSPTQPNTRIRIAKTLSMSNGRMHHRNVSINESCRLSIHATSNGHECKSTFTQLPGSDCDSSVGLSGVRQQSKQERATLDSSWSQLSLLACLLRAGR